MLPRGLFLDKALSVLALHFAVDEETARFVYDKMCKGQGENTHT